MSPQATVAERPAAQVDELVASAQAARRAARVLATLPTEVKDRAILAIADALEANVPTILEANARDVEGSRRGGRPEHMVERLMLNQQRIRAIAADARNVAALPDPVGEVIEERTRPNGLRISRVRVPLGVIGVIYESRPNVTVDIACLCLKAGSAVLLRGSAEALRSNAVLADLMANAVAGAGVPHDAIQLIRSEDRAMVDRMLKARGLIDVIIPRGGAGLIAHAVENSVVPVIETGAGVCHTYVDASADVGMAVDVVYNAKVRRPTICNALDTLLVHRAVAPRLLAAQAARMAEAGVEMRCDEEALGLLQGAPGVRPAQPQDFGREFLSLAMGIKVVDSLDAAIEHIHRHGSGHSEAIITADQEAAERFVREIDAAAVYVNASTQFTDGAQFGLGAEVGISTQKLHARGPMGLREMTSYKWVIRGTGQTRPV